MPIAKVGYDAERELGIVAENSSDRVVTRNTAILTDVLQSQKISERFLFTDRSNQPTLNNIFFQAKEYYWAGTVDVPPYIGTGLAGTFSNKSYPVISPEYTLTDLTGGARTRFTKVDGDENDTFFRVAGHGMAVDGIEFRARPYISDSTGEGPQTGTRTANCFLIEGREVPATGGHTWTNCTFFDFSKAFYAKAGYYDPEDLTADDDGYVTNENHTDNCLAWNCNFVSCDSILFSDNQQAVNWSFFNPRVFGFGGAGLRPCIFANMERGGSVKVSGIVDIGHQQVTLIKVKDWSPYTCAFEFDYVKWDWLPYAGAYIRFFDYAGPAFEDSSFLKWRVRIGGHLPLTGNTEFDVMDVTDVFRIRTGATNFPTSDILCDVKNLPHTNMTQSGIHWYPTSYSDWLYTP